MGAIRLIHDDPYLKGVHMSVGLSNFSVMLPTKRADGSPTKGPLESAFLTLSVPLGMDHVIGSVKRKYEILPEDHPAMLCVKDCLNLEGYDVIMRVMEYYSE
jgi:5-methyltetrahydrofolate--homocysteine methyltransferase